MTTGLRGDLTGKIVLVTGGTQGVGGAAARRAAEWGAAGVLVAGRDAAKGARAVAALEDLGTRALFVRADLAEPHAPANIIRACEDTFGRLDGLVNAAALTDRAGAYCGAPNLAVYSGSKGALATLTRNVANTLAPDRIRVNGVLLGWTDTPAEHVVQQRELPDGAQWLERAAARLPFGRLIDPEELADLIAFLLSRHAGVMTGALIDYNQTVLGAH